ncbi:4a-hydroxytetrahydrobiopterin dehydratase [Deinococcus taeanensis]|uniref:4a-hydroxytetrahydrobiopterin dehydratase n=1 Tax=Deinococcus taeanensis TaxID=2737050 RepID=UPI001CDD4D65|nr:4a-hydroxytetrahydrobiopterin dehydratase [Deinococcus taeanensis]UBV43329.1 4a-hydroxytetrahydrobiopterin dehydratase [Deinococcus taeanensis]
MAYDPRMNYDPTRKLTDGDVLEQKPEGWWGDAGKLYRDFPFPTFMDGMNFALKVAQQAEERGHHPDIHVHYHFVRVNYFTYDAGGVTRLDLESAQALNDLLGEGTPA